MTSITIHRLIDPALDQNNGHAVDGAYVETFWLPVLGPTGTWMLRRFHQWTAHGPVTTDLTELAGHLGLGSRTARNSPVVRALYRLARYGAIHLHGDQVHTRSWLSDLPDHHYRQLPEPLRNLHKAAVR